MSGLLERNQLSLIRKQIGDFIIYNVKTQEQRMMLSKVVDDSNIEILEENGQDKIKGNVELNVIRMLIKNFTNIADEIDDYSDEQLQELIDNGNGDLKDTIFEVNDLYVDFIKEHFKTLKSNLSVFDVNLESLELNLMLEEMKKKVGLEGVSNEEVQKLIEANLKKSKIKKPQDHKPKKPRKNSAKKINKEIKEVDKEIEKTINKLEEVKNGESI